MMGQTAGENAQLSVETALQMWAGERQIKTDLEDELFGVKALIGDEGVKRVLRFCPKHAREIMCDESCKSALSAVGEKLLKALASYYALLSYPKGDTVSLTNVTRVLLSGNTFEVTLEQYFGHFFGARDIFTRFVALTVYACGIQLARGLVLPVFKATMCKNDYDIALPGLLAMFAQAKSFRHLSNEERINLLCEELVKRGVVIKKTSEAFPVTNGQCERYTVEVLHQGVRTLCERGKVLNEYFAIVVEQAKHIIETKKKSEKQKFMVSKPEDFKMWMHELCCLLRLRPPYRNEIDESTFESIKQSAGWIPISEIEHWLQVHTEKTGKLQPTEDNWIELLLTKHDNMGRFEIGTCEEQGNFYGQICARALYAHEGRNTLVKGPFDGLPALGVSGACPASGWLRVEKHMMEKMCKKTPYVLYGGIPHVTIYETESLYAFQRYRLDTPPEEQYDERLSTRTSLFFLEFRLAAVLDDDKMKIVKPRNKETTPPRWIVFTQYTKESTDDRTIPLHYFTGKVAVLRTQTEDVELEKQIEMECEPAQEKELLISYECLPLCNDRGSPLTPCTDMPDCCRALPPSGAADVTGVGEESLTGKIGSSKVPAPRVWPSVFTGNIVDSVLDINEAKNKVKIDVIEGTKYSTDVTFPKCGPGGVNIMDRSKSIEKFKEWVRECGLAYSRCRHEDNSTVERYEVRRRWTVKDELLEEIAQEMGLTNIPDMQIFKQAITRECEDRVLNYEILEFIGDAVMDFVVACDSFLVGDPWHKDVNQRVCCNDVLAELIPSKLKEELSNIYHKLKTKVEADMMEGMLGAIYQSGMGLDEVRQQLRRTFMRIPIIIERLEKDDALRKTLESAREACPYLHRNNEELESLFKYNCKSLISEELFKKFGCTRENPFDSHGASHYGATPFSRIQDKVFATHFTTGVCYSYRRLPSIDLPLMFNRILSAFAANSIAFVNEMITESTHLTIDFDGANIRAWNVLHLILNWAFDKFCSKSCVFLLDCSGMSPSSKAPKQSYHVHFPQVATTLENTRKWMDELRLHIAETLRSGTLLGDVVGCQWKDADEKEHTIIGRVVLCTKLLPQKLKLRGVGKGATAKIFEFLDFNSIIKLGGTCREMRDAMLSYLYETARSSGNFICCHERGPTASESKEHLPHHVIVKARWASPHGQEYLDKLFFWPAEKLCTIKDEASEVLKAVKREMKGKECKEKEFFLDAITAGREACAFTLDYWNRVLDAGLYENRKLRMYLNDKYDMVYGQEFRPLFLAALLAPGREVQTVTPKDGEGSCYVRCKEVLKGTVNSDGVGYPVEVAHGSTLRLASLRCPEYRDVYGRLWSAWSDGSDDDDRFVKTTAHIMAVDDTLPPFGVQYKETECPSTDWTVWVGGACSLQSTVDSSGKGGDMKTAALQPAYWTYNSNCKQADFWIAGELAFSVGPCESLESGLEQHQGMEQMARYLVPSIKMKCASIRSWLFSHSDHCFPLFLSPKKRNKPAASATQARSGLAANNSQMSVPDVSFTAPASSPARCKVIDVKLNDGALEPIDLGQLYKAMNMVFCELYHPFLFVTSDESLYFQLVSCFPYVVTPKYFDHCGANEYTIQDNRTFRYIFILDNSYKPYQSKRVITGLLSLLDSERGIVLVTDPAVRELFPL